MAEPIAIDRSADLRARHRTWRRALGFGAGASLVACLLVAARLIPIGSPSGHWVYGYLQAFSPRIIVIALVVGVWLGSALVKRIRAARASAPQLGLQAIPY